VVNCAPLAQTWVLLHETKWGHAEVTTKDGVSLHDGEWARHSIGCEFGRDFLIDDVWELEGRGEVHQDECVSQWWWVSNQGAMYNVIY